MPGLIECYYLLGADFKKDSNMEATLLTHTLDIAVEHLQRRGQKLPTHLHVQADKTSREMRTQITAKWGAVLVAKGLFRSVTFGYLPVGHTQ